LPSSIGRTQLTGLILAILTEVVKPILMLKTLQKLTCLCYTSGDLGRTF
jgi:hypothetical protein